MIGETLGHYRIKAKLGEGGMGVVYKAHDTHLDRAVAIKVLSAEAVSDPERKRRFVQEARTASALNHPNILHIYDIDQEGGVDFMAMEFVAGKTLHQLAGHAGLPLDLALNYAVQIAGALARAHEVGIVHRDIKPGNIMVTPEGLVKVLDFGLAKLSEPPPDDEDAVVTRTAAPQTDAGVIMGTVEYMAPEQAEGKADARSDIFSFGAVLYEILTGQRPFQGNSKLAILAAVLGKEPLPLEEVRKDVPAGLAAVIGGCLRKDPAQRFQNMGDVRDALQVVEETLRRPRVAQRVPGRRWWLWAGIAAAAAAAVFLAIAVARRGSPGGTRQALIAVLPFQTAAADPASQASADGLRETLSRELGWLNQFQPDKRVVPPGDVRGDAALGATEARKRLGADLVLSGSLQRRGSDVLLVMTLMETNPVHEVKHSEWKAPLGDAAARQQGLVRKAAEFLDLRVTPRAGELLSAGTTTAPAAYDSYLQGYGYLSHTDRAEDLDQAVNMFQAALTKDPSYGLAQAGLGEAFWAKSTLTEDKQWVEKARESCLRAITLKANLPGVHLLLGKIYSSAGRPQDAVEEFRKALQIDPLSISARTSLGEAYESLGQLGDSESTYKALVTMWPSYIVPYSYLGSFYVQQGRYQDAEPVFRKFTELAPENSSGYQNLGAVYHLLGRTDDAVAMMKKSLAIKPSARGYTNLGTLYYFEGRYSDAVPLMEKAAEMEPDNYVYWGNLGDAYRWAPEEKDRAAEAYTHAIKLAEQQVEAKPRDAGLRSSLAGYYAKLPDNAKALAGIAQARRLAPMNPEVLFKAALVYEITGRREQAIGALDLALQSGYSIDEVRREPDLAELRKDPQYARLEARVPARGAGKRR